MNRVMLRAKVHRVQVTECEVEYEGSLTLDRKLMDLAGMLPYERVDVWNVDNGARFSTYLIGGEPGSGVCCVNGAAAHLVERGHRLILATYVTLDDAAAAEHRPGVVIVGAGNRVKQVKNYEAAGVRVPTA